MSAEEVDQYLRALDEPKRGTSVHFLVDDPLPEQLVKKLIATRLEQIP